MLSSESINVPGSELKIYPGNFNCNSSNVTYFLTCASCSMGNYIGETKSAFRLRFNNHTSSIRRHLPGLPVSEHFNSPGHSLSDLRFAILRGNYPDCQTRKVDELHWVNKIQSHKKGLNRDLSFLNHYSFVH